MRSFGIYARSAVASPEAITEQLGCCRAYGHQLGLSEAAAFADDGEGGRGHALSSGLEAALEAAREGAFNTLIVTDTDRLARDALRLDGLLETLQRYGVQVRSVRDGLIDSLSHEAFGQSVVRRIFGQYVDGQRSAEIANGLNRDRLPREKLIRWDDVRAVRQRYERRGYTDVTVTVEAADRDGVVRRWSSPEAL